LIKIQRLTKQQPQQRDERQNKN